MSNFLTAAKWTDKQAPQPHQIAAWNTAWQWLTPGQQAEFLELFRAAPAVKDSPDPAWLEPALKLIREFEGLRLEAYICPAGIPTIGYGTTIMDGRSVRLGDKITKVEAEQLLSEQVQQNYAKRLFQLIPPLAKFPANQQASLISWAYNVGLGAVEESTLRKRLLAGEVPGKVAAEELSKWNKGDGKVLPGLVRRRAAELSLFLGTQQAAEVTQQPGRLTPKSPFTAHLTPHITLGEFALGQEARRFTAQHQVDTAAELAAFLERARTAFGNKPVVITSGYRPRVINDSVGGASNSEHLYNAPSVGAVDWYIEGADIYKLQEWCIKNWPYSTGLGASKGFIHTGIRTGRPKVQWDY
jgi:GH24 family phage-related lysozyme (muramidase)